MRGKVKGKSNNGDIFASRDKALPFPAFLLDIACNVPYAGLQVQNQFIVWVSGFCFYLLTYLPP